MISARLSPRALTRRRISPGPGSGTGSSSNWRTSAGPVLWKRTIFTVLAMHTSQLQSTHLDNHETFPLLDALLDHGHAPRRQSDGAILRHSFTGQQVLSPGQSIGYLSWSSRIVKQVVNRVHIAQHTAAQDRRKVECLLLSPETSAFDAFLHNLLRECIAWHEADVGDLAFTIVVAHN